MLFDIIKFMCFFQLWLVRNYLAEWSLQASDGYML